MSIIYFLFGCSVVLALGFLAAFFWAQGDGQNDDLYTPSIRILIDDEEEQEKYPEK
jgi:cbb3-type cytochrome oxidase maturation protein